MIIDHLLQLSACNAVITDEGVKSLLMEAQQLSLLNIQGANLSNEALAHVGRYARRLALLYVQNCNAVR